MGNSVDLAISFDVTGSMSPCFNQVKQEVQKTATKLFKDVPNLRMAIIAHGDYCDGPNWIKVLDFTNDVKKVCDFAASVRGTGGGDEDEAYEFVLSEARGLNWKSENNKAFVLIGDCSPHKVGYRYGSITNKLDWQNEAKLLAQAGIDIYPVQALNRTHNNRFYDGLSKISGKPKLALNQFGLINDLVKGLTYNRVGKLANFRSELEKDKDVMRGIFALLDTLEGKVGTSYAAKNSKHEVNPARFQVLKVREDTDIKSFVEKNGLIFNRGRGFYQFTKPVLVQDYKEVILQDEDTGNMISGDFAREELGIPVGTTAKVRPVPGKLAFIQSTSNNRKLLAGTRFLYEVDYSR